MNTRRFTVIEALVVIAIIALFAAIIIPAFLKPDHTPKKLFEFNGCEVYKFYDSDTGWQTFSVPVKKQILEKDNQ